MENVNIFSFILAAIIPWTIHLLFSYLGLFRKARNTNTTNQKIELSQKGLVRFGISLIVGLLLAFFMLGFCNDIGQEGQFDNFGHGAWHGAFLSVFVVLPIIVIKGLQEQKSGRYMLVNVLYWMLTLALVGGVIDAMHHFSNV